MTQPPETDTSTLTGAAPDAELAALAADLENVAPSR